ncbi:MAG: hypothetical protein P4L50_09720 [Anaerolineaceae bacterium]|nr:hypothetical protein [Anaerolineaceae bacterium]
MNSKFIFQSQKQDEVVSIFARISRPMQSADLAPVSVQGSALTRILVIVLGALLIVGLIALAVSVFTVH